MKFMYGCFGAGVETKITASETDKICPKCNHKMQLIDGRGLLNSGTHSFLCECPKCGEKEKFSDYKLWKKCLEIAKTFQKE